MPHRKSDVQVVGIRQLTPRVREYLLRACSGGVCTGLPLPAYEPGAHVELHFGAPDTGPFLRHYSLIGGVGSWDDGRDVYRIAVQREARQRGSDHIHRTFDIGTRLQISPPRNHFLLDRRKHKTLLIAGGIGITPIYAMLRSVVRRKAAFEMVYTGRKLDDMAYAQEVMQLGGAQVRLHVSGKSGLNRRLDVQALLAVQPADAQVYACGPASLIQSVRDAAAALNIDSTRVRFESFASGSSAHDTAFDVELRTSRRQIHVGRDTSILEALASAGIPMMADCRRGECGLCPVKVLETDGSLVHRDRYLDAQDRAANHLCICVSRTTGSRLVLDA